MRFAVRRLRWVGVCGRGRLVLRLWGLRSEYRPLPPVAVSVVEGSSCSKVEGQAEVEEGTDAETGGNCRLTIADLRLPEVRSANIAVLQFSCIAVRPAAAAYHRSAHEQVSRDSTLTDDG
jgi:hypothetical protein